MKKYCIVFFSLLITPLAMGADSEMNIIGGQKVDKGERPEVISFYGNAGGCTGTVVGPRVIATSGACTKGGGAISIDGKSYPAVLVASPLYSSEDHDIGVVILNKPMKGIQPATIGGDVEKGQELRIFGYGCHTAGGGGASTDLYSGKSEVVRTINLDVESKGDGLCFGDSGGPAYVLENNHVKLVGVASKGNIQDTNFHTRLDIQESKDFFERIVKEYDVSICGINQQCPSIDLDGDFPSPSMFGFSKSEFYFETTVGKKLVIDLDSLLKEGHALGSLGWKIGGTKPHWLNLNDEYSLLLGTPDKSQAGKYVIALGVTNQSKFAVALLHIDVQ